MGMCVNDDDVEDVVVVSSSGARMDDVDMEELICPKLIMSE